MSGSAPPELREVECRSLHPRGCGAAIRGTSIEALLAAAMEHGAAGHGFTSAYYDDHRRAAMRSALVRMFGPLHD